MTYNIDDTRVEELELTTRTGNLLTKHQITNMRAFMALVEREVLSWKHSGRRTWNEIADIQRDFIYHTGGQEEDDMHQLALREAAALLNELINNDASYFLRLTAAGFVTINQQLSQPMRSYSS